MADKTLTSTAAQLDDAVVKASSGNLTVEPKTTTATITLPNNKLILCDATAGAMSINLPTAVGIVGRKATIKKTDASANAVTVDGNGAETINGETTYILQFQYSAMTLVSNGTSWDIV